VTKHGAPIAVIVDFSQWHRLKAGSDGLMDYLRAEPTLDSDLEVDRPGALPRVIDLHG
jgi:hypothetical protein